jgi:hypothetical protein
MFKHLSGLFLLLTIYDSKTPISDQSSATLCILPSLIIQDDYADTAGGFPSCLLWAREAFHNIAADH